MILISINSDSDKIEDKKNSYMLGKSNRATQRVENKDQHKNLALHKVTHIRETKASRLRAASIVSSNSEYNIYYIFWSSKLSKCFVSNISFIFFVSLSGNTSKRSGVLETSTPSGSQLSANLSTKVVSNFYIDT